MCHFQYLRLCICLSKCLNRFHGNLLIKPNNFHGYTANCQHMHWKSPLCALNRAQWSNQTEDNKTKIHFPLLFSSCQITYTRATDVKQVVSVLQSCDLKMSNQMTHLCQSNSALNILHSLLQTLTLCMCLRQAELQPHRGFVVFSFTTI